MECVSNEIISWILENVFSTFVKFFLQGSYKFFNFENSKIIWRKSVIIFQLLFCIFNLLYEYSTSLNGLKGTYLKKLS